MVTIISRLGCVFLLSLLLVAGCSAGILQSPSNQLIKGPFEIDQKWRVITFDQPLLSAPYIQHLKVLLSKDKYRRVGYDSKTPLDSSVDDRKYIQLSTGKVVGFEVVLVSDTGIEIKQAMNNIGFIDTPSNTMHYFLGYGRLNTNQYFYPQDLKINSVKIKSNIPVTVDHLYWYSMNYERAPNEKWENVDSSDIINIK